MLANEESPLCRAETRLKEHNCLPAAVSKARMAPFRAVKPRASAASVSRSTRVMKADPAALLQMYSKRQSSQPVSSSASLSFAVHQRGQGHGEYIIEQEDE